MIKWEGKKANSLVRITKYIRCLGGKKSGGCVQTEVRPQKDKD